ncbi:MAG: TM2 domain-containing protein [Succinivibrionaceae bacterium]|nr:TM2 domain-containing protein [Succinivibrionaceae bacterium]
MQKDGFSSDSVSRDSASRGPQRQGGGSGSFSFDENAYRNNAQGSYGQGPVYAGRPVNKVIYILIAFFLGGFGVQEFYAGRTGLGILCALFCWTFIPALWAWVRIFMALFRPADGNGMIVM